MMKQFKTPKLSPSAQKIRDRRNALLDRALRKNSKKALEALEAEFGLRVYTDEEVAEYVEERPKLETAKVIGKSEWSVSKPNFM